VTGLRKSNPRFSAAFIATASKTSILRGDQSTTQTVSLVTSEKLAPRSLCMNFRSPHFEIDQLVRERHTTPYSWDVDANPRSI
jgi:hypothetical protein